MKKIRLDKLLVKNNYFESRSKAQFYIEAGAINVNGVVVTKKSTQVNEDDDISIIYDACPYVSKGGLKLEKAIKHFKLDFANKDILDIGASTGGFTDCALKHGARHVTAIDVGVDQLVIKLKNNSKVYSIENFNLKNISTNTFNKKFHFVVTDVSFISLKHVFKILDFVLDKKGIFVPLIKPQFELGKDSTKRGIIRSKNMHKYAIKSVVDYAKCYGYSLKNLTYSPIKGTSGNIEFLALFVKDSFDKDNNVMINQVVNKVHKELK
ncbi:MAG: TlyA family RNA methyltransferase [Clostridia bacterium]